jgi:ketosteroid isomerase-like protein
MNTAATTTALLACAAACLSAQALATPADDEKALYSLDERYQLAVKQNDADTMGRIQSHDMVLVTGRGNVYTNEQLLDSARKREIVWDKQDVIEGTRKVRLYGDTGIVTALLWLKGTSDKGPFEYKVWFSDTYVRRPEGWRYVFGQSSLPLPKTD